MPIPLQTGRLYLSDISLSYFVISYPKSDSVEIAAFRSARSYYELSPRYSLDQRDTQMALDKLQEFVNKSPTLPLRPNANAMVSELREKLEKRHSDRQYLKNIRLQGSDQGLRQFYPRSSGLSYRKEAAFYGKLEAAYLLAINSVPYLVEERLKTAKKYYEGFSKYYGESELRMDADVILQILKTTFTNLKRN